MNDVEDIKRKYYKILEKLGWPPNLKKTREWIEMTIKRINSASLSSNLDEKKSMPALTREAMEFTVSIRDGVASLVTRCPQPKTFVAWEDTFDIIANAHLVTNHGAEETVNIYILNVMSSIVNRSCISVYISLCPCATKPELIQTVMPGSSFDKQPTTATPPAKIYSSSCFMDVIGMELSVDNFKFVLVYQDMDTGYIQLRPISTNGVANEVAIEIVKLFSDFEQPQCVIINKEQHQLFVNILSRINVISSQFLFQLDYNDAYLKELTQVVRVSIENWMKSQDCTAWSAGCHFVQWQMNTSPASSGSSFEAMFGRKPNEKIQLHDVTPGVVNHEQVIVKDEDEEAL